MAKYTIKIEKDNRRQIFVEEAATIDKDIMAEDNALFHEEYLKAKKIIESFTNGKIIYERETHKKLCNPDSCPKDFPQKKSDLQSFGPKNNIIVFTGDRGTGKTSAMVSFGEYLKEKGIKTRDKSDDKAHGFKLLDIIDPSYFRKNESILLNVITMMFKMAKEYHRSCNSQYHEDCNRYKNEESNASDFNKLLEEFERVFRSVKRMDSIVPKEDSLEYLNELSDAIDLNKSIHDLIDKFLRFFKGTPKYLVLMIDDLDMNVAYASTMLEQIRKFLIQDNVIILIATNVDQLQFEMKESYSKYYDKTLNPSQQNMNVSVDVEDMANKYLLKLFPPLQRIHISDAANKLIDTKLKIEDIKDENDNHVFNDNLQKVILNLIWKKTRLIFIPEKEQLHPIIPTNLRALHQLVYILLDLEDLSKDSSNKIFKDKEDYEKAHVNFNKFKDYILNVWIPSNVSFEEQKVFDNIPTDISRINKHLIQSINIIGSKYKKSILTKEIDPKELSKDIDEKNKFDRDIYTFVSPNDPKFSHANKISDVINFPSNNAAGDILLLIDKYKTYFEAANQNNFIEAVKIYYSLLLFETMFFGSAVKTIKVKGDSKNVLVKVKKKNLNVDENNVTIQVKNINVDQRNIKAHEKNIILQCNSIVIEGEPNKVFVKNLEGKKDKSVRIVSENIAIIKESIDIKEEGEDIIIKSETIKINVEGYTIDDVNSISNIQKLIGGTLFFPHYFTIIKSQKYEDIKEKDKSESNSDKKDKPSENHLFYHSFKAIDNPIIQFYIVYYGKKRPERSYGIQIYETKKCDAEKGKEVYRFDILSLLVNTLNPYQTLARYLYNIDSAGDFEEITKKVAEWNENNAINGMLLPNSILPIYSVDLMLKYLKKQFDVSEVYLDFQDIICFSDNFTEGFVKKVKENLVRITPTEMLEKFNEFAKNVLTTLEDQKIVELKKELEEELKKGLKEKMEVKQGGENEVTLKKWMEENKNEGLKEFFEKIYLMKMMEKKARDINFISSYYEELKKLTSEALGQIESKGEISNICNAIYDRGHECFMKECNK